MEEDTRLGTTLTHTHTQSKHKGVALLTSYLCAVKNLQQRNFLFLQQYDMAVIDMKTLHTRVRTKQSNIPES